MSLESLLRDKERELQTVEEEVNELTRKIQVLSSKPKKATSSGSKKKKTVKISTKKAATPAESEVDSEPVTTSSVLSGIVGGGTFALAILLQYRGYWGFALATAAIYYYGEALAI